MKTLQKLLTVLLASALLITLPACGEKSTEKPRETEITSNTQISDTTEPTDEPTPKSAYTGILTYDYAIEAGYYSCMYITPDRVYLWNSKTEPNLTDPTASVGFAQSYDEALPRKQFEQATAAITEKFLLAEKTAAESDIIKPVATLQAPETHIAVYRDGKLYRHRRGVGIVETAAAETRDFRALHAELTAIRDGIEAQGNLNPRTVALLYCSQSADGYSARYLTADQCVSWESNAAPDWIAPLNGIDTSIQTVKKASFLSLLTDLGYVNEYLPLRVYQNPDQIFDIGDLLNIIVFYREDGSMRIIAAHSNDHDSKTLNGIRARYAVEFATPE